MSDASPRAERGPLGAWPWPSPAPVRAVVVFQLMDEPAGDIAVDGSRARPAERRRIGERLGRDDALAEIVGEGRAVDRAERRLDEADLRPAARAERVAVGDGAAAAGTGRRQQRDRPRAAAAAQPRRHGRTFERQHPAMLSRPRARVTISPLLERTPWSHAMVAQVTDKSLLRRRLARAHRTAMPGATFLLERVVADLAERLAAIERRFPIGDRAWRADRSARSGASCFRQGRPASFGSRQTAAALADRRSPGAVGDEEALPLGPASIDLFVSTLALQWTNDLPGALMQIRTALRPDGLFLAAMTGGRTLAELREALFAAESEMRGGASPRVIPAADVRDLGALLQRAGFALPVADRDAADRALRFSLRSLPRSAGDGRDRTRLPERDRRPAGRRLFLRAAEIYAERFSDRGRARSRDLRDHLAVGLGAAREPAEAGAARIECRSALRRCSEAKRAGA